MPDGLLVVGAPQNVPQGAGEVGDVAHAAKRAVALIDDFGSDAYGRAYHGRAAAKGFYHGLAKGFLIGRGGKDVGSRVNGRQLVHRGDMPEEAAAPRQRTAVIVGSHAEHVERHGGLGLQTLHGKCKVGKSFALVADGATHKRYDGIVLADAQIFACFVAAIGAEVGGVDGVGDNRHGAAGEARALRAIAAHILGERHDVQPFALRHGAFLNGGKLVFYFGKIGIELFLVGSIMEAAQAGVLVSHRPDYGLAHVSEETFVVEEVCHKVKVDHVGLLHQRVL